jgi:hypothetical protein
MPKKPLIVKTKLKKRPFQDKPAKKIGLKKAPKDYPKSYRWRESDLEMIRQLLERVNEVSPRKIDATKLLRGALALAMEYHPEKLLEAIGKAESRSLF